MNNSTLTITRHGVFERIEINPIEQTGYQAAEKAVKDYLSLNMYPGITGEDRKQWVANRLQKIRWRYFEPV